jgi:hypothetical protein
MEAKYPEILLGATICQKLKELYHPNEPWHACHNKVALRLTELKKIMRKFYADKNDKELLSELVKYNQDDLRDVFCST